METYKLVEGKSYYVYQALSQLKELVGHHLLKGYRVQGGVSIIKDENDRYVAVQAVTWQDNTP